MTKFDKVFLSVLSVLLFSLICVVYIGTPNHSRKGKMMFVGVIPVMVKSETEHILPHKFITVIGINAVGQLYQIELPSEAVSDVPVLKGNPQP